MKFPMIMETTLVATIMGTPIAAATSVKIIIVVVIMETTMVAELKFRKNVHNRQS